MSGAVWGGPEYIGRDLRAPQPHHVVRDPKVYPGSAAVDAALHGDRPVVTHDQSEHDDAVVPGQVYGRPTRGDVHRDSRTGLAQVIEKAAGRQKQHTVSQPAGEVAGERYPPRGVPGLEVHRDHGGGQILPLRAASAVVDQLGAYFSDGEPSPLPGPVCAYCFAPMEIPTRVGTTQKKYCSRSHKTLAAQKRKRDAANIA